MKQLHKRFTDEQVKELLQRYIERKIKREYIQQLFGIKRRRFCILVKRYIQNPDTFSIKYTRTTKTRFISQDIEKNIIKELKIDKQLINDKEIPLRHYNYSYIQNRLVDKYKQKVSLPTIINRAKRNDLYIARKSIKKVHDREVLTNYAGELIQHDSSYHLWSPYAPKKWYLITSIDDYSRFMFYAKIVSHESSWAHIKALETVFLKYGLPFSYYVDNHSIFRFVRGRDDLHNKHYLSTDEVNPQWKQVLDECNVKVTFALSPQAKGKIERPYAWLQDRLVRTCAREHITDIIHAQHIVNNELIRYNYHQVHSTTGEIPYLRLKKALTQNISMFRKFVIPEPFISIKDIFCLRLIRTANAYRKISINNFELKVNKLNPYETVQLRIYPLNPSYSEVRFWANNKLMDIQKLKNNVFNSVHF